MIKIIKKENDCYKLDLKTLPKNSQKKTVRFVEIRSSIFDSALYLRRIERNCWEAYNPPAADRIVKQACPACGKPFLVASTIFKFAKIFRCCKACDAAFDIENWFTGTLGFVALLLSIAMLKQPMSSIVGPDWAGLLGVVTVLTALIVLPKLVYRVVLY